MSERVSDERLAELIAFYEGWQGQAGPTLLDLQTLPALRDLAAARASLDEALGLLRDVGTDGRFSLSAVNSDEADDWYDKRDALLRKVGM